MAEASVVVDQNQFSCSICLDLLKDPVTTSCGHNYCMRCIKRCWDREDHVGVYSCPQCRETFTSRPVLGRNTMLAEVVENLKKTETADVECGACTGRKHKAVKSCLVCLDSYCETHLQLHNKLHHTKQHKLIDAISHLKDKVCSHHDKRLEIYCRTDQQCICYLCTMDEHRGHDTVSAAAGREEIQTQMGEKQREFQQGIQTREKELQELREAVGSFTSSAQSAVKDSKKIFLEMIRSIKKRRSDVKELIRDQEKAVVSLAEGHMERLEQEIDELKRRHSEMEQLSHTEDHIHFLQRCQDVPVTPEAGFGPRISVSSQSCFGNVRKVISELKDQLENVCEKKTAEIHHTVTKDTIPPVSVPTTRSEFLQSTEVTMSPVSVPRTTAGFLQSTEVTMSPVSVPRTTAGFLQSTKVSMSPVSVPRTTAGFLPFTKVTMSPVSVPRTTAGFLPSTKVTMSPVSVPRTTAGFLQSTKVTMSPVSVPRTTAGFLPSTKVTMSPVSVPRTTAGFLQSTKVTMSPVSVPRTTAGFLPSTEVTMSPVSVPRTTAGFLQSTKVTMSPVSVPRTTAGFLQSTKVTMSPVSVPRTTAGFLPFTKVTMSPVSVPRTTAGFLPSTKVTMSPVSVPRTTAGFLQSTKVTMSPVSVPRTTAGFLQYSCQLTLDPNTAHRCLSLSEGNRKVTWGAEQPYPDHPERFDWWDQILCKKSFTSHAYWEAEWSGGGAEIGVTYKGIGRKGWSDDCRLGMNDKSWMLSCSPCRYSVWHNNKETDIPIKPSDSRRVGVYLDWMADTLSFYRVSSEGLTLLYSFTASFTDPLCPAFWVYYTKSSVSLCMLG
ncbi:E3 ubiquitin/ISG15 ligase TRIM25-like [Brienomyrus brachyistius]|uniref:E3 ubiquitin/ISG15 ligase TRIM25-like n=1 Tax=Brienomyrus brachyistius TaxID=42636 RepID=UPI0020B402A8|nr:E3 ubiquitin/ISG15 ligase TRIM25-like [Brienomyrus brachyistius]